MRKLKPLPKNQSEILQEAFVPYDNTISKTSSDTVFSKNRAKEISFKGSKQKDFSVSLKDHDEVIKYYFENTIKPSVIQNGERVMVPIMYGSPERWKTVQSEGALRDKSGKLLTPLIMFKRDTLEKNRSLGNKLDGNKVHNYQLFEQKFNKRNSYDRFSVITNRQPSKEVFMSVVPDYVTLTYSCIIFTDYVEQINPIIEAINFASDSYWGDFSRFKFRARIDQFSTVTEVNTTDGRAVRSTFNIILNGYIIPDTINKQIANADMYYGTAQVVFNFETTTADLDTLALASTSVTSGGTTSTTIFEGGSNITINVQGSNALDTDYLVIMINKTAVSKTNNTATFNASFAEPGNGSTLPPTSKLNFTFYVNGVFVPQDYITSFVDNGGGTCILTLDTNGLGYELESTDEITAVGKFQ
jgi:hypothetical protein